VQVGSGKFIAAHLHIAFSPLAGQSTPRGKNIPANRENGPFLAKLRNMSPLTRQRRPHRSVDLVSGPRLEAKRYEGRSNLGITNQSNSGGVSGLLRARFVDRCSLSMSAQSTLSPRAVTSSNIAHAAFRRRDTHSSKHLCRRLSPSAIRAVSIAPYPSMMPA
jgi:hypothetical protein